MIAVHCKPEQSKRYLELSNLQVSKQAQLSQRGLKSCQQVYLGLDYCLWVICIDQDTSGVNQSKLGKILENQWNSGIKSGLFENNVGQLSPNQGKSEKSEERAKELHSKPKGYTGSYGEPEKKTWSSFWQFSTIPINQIKCSYVG